MTNIKSRNGNKQILLPVNNFRDQDKHEEWMEMHDQDGNVTRTKLRISV